MTIQAKWKWILATAAAIGVMGTAFGVVGEYTGWKRPWVLQDELAATASEVRAQADLVKAELIKHAFEEAEHIKVAGEERRDLYYRQWNSEAQFIQRQLYQTQREMRDYQRQRQPIPEAVRREKAALERQLHDAEQQRKRYLQR